MIDLKTDAVVLQKLQVDYPRPGNSAAKALDSYCALLRELITDSQLKGRSTFDVMKGVYTVAVKRLSQDGPTIGGGGKKQRLHAWLKANNLELIEFVEKGNNLRGKLSKVKLSKYVTLIDAYEDLGKQLRLAKTNADIVHILDGDPVENGRMFDALFPDFYVITKAQRQAAYEFVPVDMKSLRAYIYWLQTAQTNFSHSTVQMFTAQALQILRVAVHTKGKYVQKKNPSKFGRMYYTGLSVQNVNKTLRRAMLGNSWEYDIRSSATAIKLGFAGEALNACGNAEHPRNVFRASFMYVERKKELVNDICAETFLDDSGLSKEKQAEWVKEALTAIGFGATASAHGWRSKDGSWSNPAIVKILRNSDERFRFLNQYFVKKFIEEQAELDAYIVGQIKSEFPEVWESDLFMSGKKRSNAKAVAWLYQHIETKAMNAARDVIKAKGVKVLANIHDAVVLQRKLSEDSRDEVEWTMRDSTGIPYLYLKATQLEGFEKVNIEVEEELDFRVTPAQFLASMKKWYPDGDVPDEFDFSDCVKEF